jgi:hypothetical protein
VVWTVCSIAITNETVLWCYEVLGGGSGWPGLPQTQSLSLQRLPGKTRGKLAAITGLWCPSMFWAARALQCGWQRVREGERVTLLFFSWAERLGKSWKPPRVWARWLKLFIFNEEFLVGALHQSAPIMSLPFVHTARRSYRLNAPVRTWDGTRSGDWPRSRTWTNLSV